MVDSIRSMIVPTLVGSVLLLLYFLLSRIVDIVGVATSSLGAPVMSPTQVSAGVVIGAASHVLSVAAAYLLLKWAYEHIPGKSPFVKGLWFGLVLLLLLRQLVVEHYVLGAFGHPLWAGMLNQLMTWVVLLGVSVILAWFVARERSQLAAR